MAHAAALYAALFDDAVMVVEWNRLGAFQDVTLRLIAEAMLPEVGGGKEARTYLQGELRRADVSLPKPRGGLRFHVYCSPYNAGAVELMAEVCAKQGISIEVTERVENLLSCERMLVYLTRKTWTSGQSTAFAREVERAILADVRLLLCHEMPGVDGEARHAVDFGAFFACDEGTTPDVLKRGGIYDQIATPLKGGAWRPASMALVTSALMEEPNVLKEEAEPEPQDAIQSRRTLTRAAATRRQSTRREARSSEQAPDSSSTMPSGPASAHTAEEEPATPAAAATTEQRQEASDPVLSETARERTGPPAEAAAAARRSEDSLEAWRSEDPLAA